MHPEMLKKQQSTTLSRSLKTWQEFFEKRPTHVIFFVKDGVRIPGNGIDNAEGWKSLFFYLKIQIVFHVQRNRRWK